MKYPFRPAETSASLIDHPDATIAHGVIILNGLCATNSNLVQMMNFQLERAFGRVLGLDYSQVNPDAVTSDEPKLIA